MTLALDENNAAYQIRAYQPGKIHINDLIFYHSIIVTPEKLIDHWKPQHLSELTADDLAVILTLKPTILLIGTGDRLQFPDVSVYGDLINQGIGVEIMDTRAACRTFNALTAENRQVAAALILNKI